MDSVTRLKSSNAQELVEQSMEYLYEAVVEPDGRLPCPSLILALPVQESCSDYPLSADGDHGCWHAPAVLLIGSIFMVMSQRKSLIFMLTEIRIRPKFSSCQWHLPRGSGRSWCFGHLAQQETIGSVVDVISF
jgi:hypothetical protein